MGASDRTATGVLALEIEILAEELRVSAFIERVETAPEGFFGGRTGTKSQLLVKRDGDSDYGTVPDLFGTVCKGKFSDVCMKRGDTIRLETAGGGGYGDPLDRDLARAAYDVENGFVSAQAAEEAYRVRVNGRGEAERI